MNYGGYAGNILRVNLSSGDMTKVSTETYSDLFLGGRGIAARIYWDEVPPQIDALDPENRLIFMTGPLSGIPGFASRFQVCGKSAHTNLFSYSNLGGSWGAFLKYAGYDGIVVHGKAAKPVYLSIDGDSVELRDAAHLKGQSGFHTESKIREELGKTVRVLTVGPAGDNMVSFASFLAAENSCGAGGLAAVMGSKNLKAIAVRGNTKVPTADPERMQKVKERINDLRANLPESMRTLGWIPPVHGLKSSLCRGCPTGCIRVTYRKPGGEERKFMCQGALFYGTRAQRYYGEENDVPLRATEICDDYGVDTRSIETMIMWLSRCHKAGLVSDEETGIPFSRMGSWEFIETLVRKISLREGFGDLLARGTHKAAEKLGSDTQKLLKDYITSTGDNDIYGPRLFLTTGIFYAVEPRFPIHQLHEISVPVIFWSARIMGMNDIFVTSDVMRSMARRFYGSEIAADFSTYEGKAEAAARIEDREYAKESLILCDLSWPIYFAQNSPDHVGDPTVESQACAAATGKDLDESGLYQIGERVLNLQRAILAREGHRGREFDTIDEFNFTTPLKTDFVNPDCLVPGKNGEPFSRKGMVVDRAEFEKMKDEFYGIRGWDIATGLQTKAKLEELNLADVAQTLESEGLLR
ncbi:MAG: aldehyde ferredoxin oxidoreductase N-terminal domain-containing protein [Dehalococcoidia bacterium]